MDTETVILIVALILGLYMAWNIGANDVANAMGTSVGSGALTLKKALIIAGILEFCGAFFIGAHVSETIECGIVNPDFFQDKPMVLVFGMLSALLAAGVWLQIASYYGWPVSTTHSVVGAVVGFGIVLGGVGSICWGSLLSIVLSWIISPLIGGVLSYSLFKFLRKKIINTSDPIKAASKIAPFLVFSVFVILSLVVFYQGLKHLNLDFSLAQSLGLALTIGLVTAIASRFLLKELPVEKIFTYLQILSACCMAFAHGANDVSNAIGPLAAIISVLKNGVVTLNAAVPLWVLALGGVGIVVGLGTWGWRVIETVGKKITELTPSRGFAAEFGASVTILLASRLGLPVSTTHTLIGAILGVGLVRGVEALNIKTIKQIVMSWVITVPVGAILAIIFYFLFSFLFG